MPLSYLKIDLSQMTNVSHSNERPPCGPNDKIPLYGTSMTPYRLSQRYNDEEAMLIIWLNKQRHIAAQITSPSFRTMQWKFHGLQRNQIIKISKCTYSN